MNTLLIAQHTGVANEVCANRPLNYYPLQAIKLFPDWPTFKSPSLHLYVNQRYRFMFNVL